MSLEGMNSVQSLFPASGSYGGGGMDTYGARAGGMGRMSPRMSMSPSGGMPMGDSGGGAMGPSFDGGGMPSPTPINYGGGGTPYGNPGGGGPAQINYGGGGGRAGYSGGGAPPGWSPESAQRLYQQIHGNTYQGIMGNIAAQKAAYLASPYGAANLQGMQDYSSAFKSANPFFTQSMSTPQQGMPVTYPAYPFLDPSLSGGPGPGVIPPGWNSPNTPGGYYPGMAPGPGQY